MRFKDHDAGFAMQVKHNPGSSRERWDFDGDLSPLRDSIQEAWGDLVDALAGGFRPEDVRIVGLVVMHEAVETS